MVVALPVITDAILHEARAIECNRCGKCCILPSGKPCKFLRQGSDGRTRCAIWNRAGRIGTPIGEGQSCNNVMFVPRLYEGCPYNALKIKHGLVKDGV